MLEKAYLKRMNNKVETLNETIDELCKEKLKVMARSTRKMNLINKLALHKNLN